MVMLTALSLWMKKVRFLMVMTLWLFVQALRKKGELAGNSLVSTIMSNKGLEFSLLKQGIKVHRTAVGDRNVVKLMREKGISLGGEQSGHIIWGNRATTGDGVLAALFVLRVMIEEEQPLSQLKAF